MHMKEIQEILEILRWVATYFCFLSFLPEYYLNITCCKCTSLIVLHNRWTKLKARKFQAKLQASIISLASLRCSQKKNPCTGSVENIYQIKRNYLFWARTPNLLEIEMITWEISSTTGLLENTSGWLPKTLSWFLEEVKVPINFLGRFYLWSWCVFVTKKITVLLIFCSVCIIIIIIAFSS